MREEDIAFVTEVLTRRIRSARSTLERLNSRDFHPACSDGHVRQNVDGLLVLLDQQIYDGLQRVLGKDLAYAEVSAQYPCVGDLLRAESELVHDYASRSLLERNGFVIPIDRGETSPYHETTTPCLECFVEGDPMFT